MLPFPTLLYWILNILGWVIYFGLLVVSQPKNDFYQTILTASLISCIFNIILSHIFRIILLRKRIFDNYSSQLYIIIILTALFGGIIFYLFNYLVWNLIFNLKISGGQGQIFSGMLLYLIWLVIYSVYFYIKKSNHQQIINYRLDAVSKQVELDNLKNQINPHFMFNALNSVNALIDENPSKAKQSILQLSNVLRHSLTAGRKKFIKLSEEINITEDYLNIEKIRYENRLNYLYNGKEELNDYKIPPFMIQTLVENAIKHGVAKTINQVNIIINISADNFYLYIEVQNEGKLSESKSNTKVGLNNIKKRLKLLYTENASFDINQVENQVISTIKIPLEL